jgi:hypothetical protein
MYSTVTAAPAGRSASADALLVSDTFDEELGAVCLVEELGALDRREDGLVEMTPAQYRR